MSGQTEGGGGLKKKDHNLESDFTLEAGQEDVVCVDLEGEWSEQSKIFSHPSYKTRTSSLSPARLAKVEIT